MTDTLIQRLRDWRGDPDEVMSEAADALEQQAADLAYVKAASVFNLMEENKRQAAQIEALRADAERYRWLRMRLKVREQRSMSGSYKDSIYIRVAQSFFDTPTRGDDGYLDKSIFAKECCQFDAAIDAALRQERPDRIPTGGEMVQPAGEGEK